MRSSGRCRGRIVRMVLFAAAVAAGADAQPVASGPPAVLQGPAPPVAPAVVSRDADGRATVRATRVHEPVRLDGRLDEPVFQDVRFITDFVQQLPDEGQTGSQRTEAWVLFDDENIYIAARCYDTAPPDEWVANEMRRDVIQLRQNDSFSVLLDTFYDRRNGVAFLVNPIGGFSDFEVSNEGGRVNSDWNTIWDSRTGRFDGGWTVEIRIPFKSLRYRPGPVQVWGLQLRRIVRRRTEASYLTALPISAARGNSVIAGLWRVSQAGSLVGLEAPPERVNLEIKPYAIGGVTSDLTATPAVRNATDGEAGFDIKYGVTRNLTADFTYNTDFAQVEVDEQQVNLTRFSLFFPEKREFFLESRGNFDFAQGGRDLGGGLPTLFFSRKIGLQDKRVVSIRAGGRLTGKVGAFDIGALNIRTGARPGVVNAQTGEQMLPAIEATNFTVLRIKRDILRRSAIGGIITNRSVSLEGDGGGNQAYGLDGRFAFFDDVNILGYAARTGTRGRAGRDASYGGQFNYAGDRYGVAAGHVVIEDNFLPEVGFIRRVNMRQSSAALRFSPRPVSIDWIRRFSVTGALSYVLAADTRLLATRTQDAGFELQLENSDLLTLSASDRYEVLFKPFPIAPAVTLPVGGYRFRDAGVSYSFGQQRPLSGIIAVRSGRFWSGDGTSLDLGRGRVEIVPQLSVEPSVSFNWVDLPEGRFTTHLGRVRVNYTVSPRMFFSGLLQYNGSADIFSTNVRLRWEYSPGSELFVVYTEERDTDMLMLMPDRGAGLRNRGFVVKLNRMFRF